MVMVGEDEGEKRPVQTSDCVRSASASINPATFTPIQKDQLWIFFLVPDDPVAPYNNTLTFILNFLAPARTQSVSFSQERKTSDVCVVLKTCFIKSLMQKTQGGKTVLIQHLN